VLKITLYFFTQQYDIKDTYYYQILKYTFSSYLFYLKKPPEKYFILLWTEITELGIIANKAYIGPINDISELYQLISIKINLFYILFIIKSKNSITNRTFKKY
jgi:hypothetical protein